MVMRQQKCVCVCCGFMCTFVCACVCMCVSLSFIQLGPIVKSIENEITLLSSLSLNIQNNKESVAIRQKKRPYIEVP